LELFSPPPLLALLSSLLLASPFPPLLLLLELMPLLLSAPVYGQGRCFYRRSCCFVDVHGSHFVRFLLLVMPPPLDSVAPVIIGPSFEFAGAFLPIVTA
jgi:hypothetical protein